MTKTLEKARPAIELLRVLSNQFAKAILELLFKKPGITVTEIYCELRLEQSVVSQHLSNLRKYNLVISEREGKNISYRINEKRLAGLDLLLTQINEN